MDNDLEIFHGTGSWVRSVNPVSNFFITSGLGLQLRVNSGEIALNAVADGATELFYNNAEKLETTNDGINVTGHTETDTLHVSGISTFGGNVGIDTAAPNTKLNIFNESPSNTGGILVQNVLYGNNQDKPYLTAGTKNWTGATTNWGTHGFVHKFKTTSGGSPRITIDSEQGEQFSITNNGKVGIATTGNIGARLNIPISGDYGRETLRLVGNSESDWSAHNLGYIYSIAWGDPITTQLGIGPYPQSRTIFLVVVME